MPATDDLQLLIEAAHASGDIARMHFNASPEVWDKAGNAGPVTEADLAIDDMLRTNLLAARATYGWLSEETEDDSARLSRDRIFIVDPIDGTRAFIAGEQHFSHSLAIAESGRITTAVVYVPMMDLLFAATDSSEATLNGAAIATSPQENLDGATVLATKPNLRPEYWIGDVPPIQRKFRPSLAYRLCLVAQGRYDAMLTLRDCWEWDIAAGDLLMREAGATCTDKAGNRLRFNNRVPKLNGLIGAAPGVHSEISQRLEPATSDFV